MEWLERALVNLDDGALGALYRVAIGFLTLPVMYLLLGNDTSDWAVVPFLMLVLLLLRILPAIIRKLIPFSNAAREAWAARRSAAKRYDSYQWRKLLWIGVGLALWTAVSGQGSLVPVLVSSVCLLAGAAAEMRWRAVSTAGRFSRPPKGKAQGAM
jgi:hypothetical protein